MSSFRPSFRPSFLVQHPDLAQIKDYFQEYEVTVSFDLSHEFVEKLKNYLESLNLICYKRRKFIFNESQRKLEYFDSNQQQIIATHYQTKETISKSSFIMVQGIFNIYSATYKIAYEKKIESINKEYELLNVSNQYQYFVNKEVDSKMDSNVGNVGNVDSTAQTESELTELSSLASFFLDSYRITINESSTIYNVEIEYEFKEGQHNFEISKTCQELARLMHNLMLNIGLENPNKGFINTNNLLQIGLKIKRPQFQSEFVQTTTTTPTTTSTTISTTITSVDANNANNTNNVINPINANNANNADTNNLFNLDVNNGSSTSARNNFMYESKSNYCITLPKLDGKRTTFSMGPNKFLFSNLGQPVAVDHNISCNCYLFGFAEFMEYNKDDNCFVTPTDELVNSPNRFGFYYLIIITHVIIFSPHRQQQDYHPRPITLLESQNLLYHLYKHENTSLLPKNVKILCEQSKHNVLNLPCDGLIGISYDGLSLTKIKQTTTVDLLYVKPKPNKEPALYASVYKKQTKQIKKIPLHFYPNIDFKQLDKQLVEGILSFIVVECIYDAKEKLKIIRKRDKMQFNLYDDVMNFLNRQSSSL